METWSMVSGLSAAFAALVILIAAIIALLQLNEIRKARRVDALVNLVQFLQNEDTRKARGILIEELSEKEFKNWSEDERKQAEKPCHTYNFAGIMDAQKFVEKDFIAKKWRNSVIRCWEAARPMIEEYRVDRGSDFWEDFEALYNKAKQYN